MTACTDFLNNVRSKVTTFCEQIEHLDSPDGMLCGFSERASLFLDKHLPANVALITKTALRSIHYIVTIVLLPTPLSLAAVGVVFAHKINTQSSNTETLLNGVAFGFLINGVRSLLFLNVLACIVNVVAATVLFSASPFVETMANAFSASSKTPVEDSSAADSVGSES